MAAEKHPQIDESLEQSVRVDSPILPQWLTKLCQPSRMLWLGPLLGFLLTVPSIFSGFKLDDHIFKQQTIDNSVYHHRAAWDYFNWVSSDAESASHREKSIFVGWFYPDSFRWHFFRPVTSLVHAFQFRAFGNAPWVMHLILALLYSLLIFLCARLLMRFSSSPTAIGIAILIFAIDDTHTYSSGWIAQYNTMLCCVFGLFALLMHDHWRSRKSAVGLLLSVAGFVLAILSSEGGLALMGYLVAYALFMESGTLRSKVASLVPNATIAGGYLFFYFLQELGTRSHLEYLSLADNYWLTIYTIVSNTLLFSVSQILSIALVTPVLQLTGLAGIGVAALLLGLLVYVFRGFLASNRRAAFFGVGMVLAIVPFTVGFISDRLLLWAGLGGAGLLGELLTAQAARIGRPQRAVARTLLVTNTIVSFLLFVPLLLFHFSLEKSARDLEGVVPRKDTVLLNSSNGFAFMYGPALRYGKGGEWPEHFYYLYCGADTLSVQRTGKRTLQASLTQGWIADSYSKSRRSKEYFFNKGDTLKLELMNAVIQQVTPDARPLKVTFEFKKDLSEFAWLKWGRKGPEECGVPVLGEEMKLVAPLF